MFNVYASEYRQYVDEIPLGNQGEDNARCLVVDITDTLNEFGSTGTLEVRNVRPGESSPYVVNNASIISTTGTGGATLYYAKWVLDDTDTARAGSGSVQVRYTISEVQCFTWIYKYFIRPSLGVVGPTPGPYDDLIETIKEYADSAAESAQSASDDASAASDDAASASGSAETAEAYAKGTVNGTPVTSGQTGYQDNSKYYKDEAYMQASMAINAAAGAMAAMQSLAPEYDSTATYAVGDYVLKSGTLYRCTTAITTAEAWTPAHWTQASITGDVSDLKSALNSIGLDVENGVMVISPVT